MFQNQNQAQMNNNMNIMTNMNNNMNNNNTNMNNMNNNNMNNNNMNNNMNMNISPYMQQVQSVLSQIVPNGQTYNLDMGNSKNMLLSLIHSSIKILDHPHPLYSCLTPQRAQYSQSWTCRKCGCNYTYNIPSFYCTACDFDLCQKCLIQYQLYQIELYDYKNNSNNFNDIMINPNDPNLRSNIHNHSMKLIQVINYNANKYNICCLKCKNKINSGDNFFYCSLCNFFVCNNCFNNSQNSQQQMNQQIQPFNNQMNQMNNQMNMPNQGQNQFQNQNPQMSFMPNQQNQNQGFNPNQNNQGYDPNQNQGYNPNQNNQGYNPNQNQGYISNNLDENKFMYKGNILMFMIILIKIIKDIILILIQIQTKNNLKIKMINKVEIICLRIKCNNKYMTYLIKLIILN